MQKQKPLITYRSIPLPDHCNPRLSPEFTVIQEILINKKKIGILHNIYGMKAFNLDRQQDTFYTWILHLDAYKHSLESFQGFETLQELKNNLEIKIDYIIDNYEDLL